MKKLNISLFVIFFTIIFLLVFFIFSLFDFDDKKENVVVSDQISNQKNNSTIDIDSNFSYPKLSSVGGNYLSEIKDLHDSLKMENSNNELVSADEFHFLEPDTNINLKKIDDTPKLVIIIDDVSFKYQVRQIHKLNLPITMSFFPPDKRHPNTAKFAKKEKMYMVHFPLEAINFHHEEIDTLHVGDSFQKIKKRVDFILEQFPNLKFTNNHTGSKFTSNYRSMKNLITILQSKGVLFVDSVTTAKTVVPILAKELNFVYLRRDIFIDNELKVNKILKQLKKAIKLAKKRGYAIVIGHPHKATLKALSQIKPYLTGIKLVYINELYDSLK